MEGKRMKPRTDYRKHEWKISFVYTWDHTYFEPKAWVTGYAWDSEWLFTSQRITKELTGREQSSDRVNHPYLLLKRAWLRRCWNCQWSSVVTCRCHGHNCHMFTPPIYAPDIFSSFAWWPPAEPKVPCPSFSQLISSRLINTERILASIFCTHQLNLVVCFPFLLDMDS